MLAIAVIFQNCPHAPETLPFWRNTKLYKSAKSVFRILTLWYNSMVASGVGVDGSLSRLLTISIEVEQVCIISQVYSVYFIQVCLGIQ